MIHPAAKFQFERAVHEYVQWRAVAEDARSPAAAWWWSPAFAVAQVQDPLPADWAELIGLPAGASYADAAQVFLKALAGQASLPWPDDFPRRYQHVPTDRDAGQQA